MKKENFNTSQWQEFFKDKSPEEVERFKKLFEKEKPVKKRLTKLTGNTEINFVKGEKSAKVVGISLVVIIFLSLFIIIPYSIRERKYSAPVSSSYQQAIKPKGEFGLSESQRRKVFQEYVKAEDRASMEEANINKHKDISPEECYQTLYSLEEKYKNEIAKRYGLTRKQLEKISMEGINKKWPIPKWEY